MERWLLEVREYVEFFIVIMFVGNKCDLKYLRVVFLEDVKKYVNDFGLLFIEVLVLDFINVEEVFI